jgi:hypothetical protein
LNDEWELANGFVVGVNESMVDTDGDGHSNLLEYRAGTNPHSPADYLRFESVSTAGSIVTLKFNARANHSYILQRSDNLKTWTDIASHAAQAVDHQVTLNDAFVPPKYFYRLAPFAP